MVPQDPLQGDVSNLVEEYRSANPKFVSIENVDPFRSVGRAGEVQAKYKLAAQENVVIVDCEGRNKIITDDKMADVDNSGAMMGQPPQITAFTGEQAVTAALIEVTEGKKEQRVLRPGPRRTRRRQGQAAGGRRHAARRRTPHHRRAEPAQRGRDPRRRQRGHAHGRALRSDRARGQAALRLLGQGRAHLPTAQPRRIHAAPRRVPGQARHQTRRRPRVAHPRTRGRRDRRGARRLRRTSSATRPSPSNSPGSTSCCSARRNP